jgi:hypothetical protein
MQRFVYVCLNGRAGFEIYASKQEDKEHTTLVVAMRTNEQELLRPRQPNP